MMLLFLRLWGISILISLTACSTLQVTSDFDPSANFTKLKTFAWEVPAKEKTGNVRLDNPILEKRIKANVENVLAAKGFTKLDSGTPDFYIGYHVALQDKVSVSSMNNYYGYAPGWGWNYAYAGGVDVYQYEQGSLTLDIVDSASNQLIWRGSAQAEVDQFAKDEKKKALLEEAITKILSGFPPKK